MVTAAIGTGASALILSLTDQLWVVILGAVLLGLSWGVFTSVDQPLINEALRVFGSYEGLYLMCGVICMLGALLVLPVRGSK